MNIDVIYMCSIKNGRMNICVNTEVSASFLKTYVHRHLFAPGSALSKMEIYCIISTKNKTSILKKGYFFTN